MSDLDMTAVEPAGRKLTPANQNPWYVQIALYGEQEGEEVDGDWTARVRLKSSGLGDLGEMDAEDLKDTTMTPAS